MLCSNEVFVGVKIVTSQILVVLQMLLYVGLVPEEPANSTEPIAELESFLTSISHKLDSCTAFLVVFAHPFAKTLNFDDFEFHASVWIFEVLRVLFLLLVQVVNFSFTLGRVSDLISVHFQVFKQDNCLEGSNFHSF